MASSNDFIPSRESELVTFSNNFDAKITASATSFGLDAAQATAYNALHMAFVTAYQVANNPDTRSPSNIATKNTAKEALIDGPGGIRALARIVQAFPAITPARLTELGLTVRDTVPTPIAPPTDAPELDFINTGTRIIKIRLHNEQTLSKRKPDGVKGATLFTFIGEEAPTDLNDWNFESNSTKTEFEIDPPASVLPGTKIWFTAFWRNPTVESGPPSTPVSTIVQYGGLAQAA